MADELDLERTRDLRSRGAGVWTRRLLLLVLIAVPVLGLFNVFGQRASEATATSDAADLTIRAPDRVRGGLLFEARFTIVVHRDLRQATLDLGSGWADGLTINTLEPSPTQETSDNGDLSLQFGELPAGTTFVFHMEFQVNPTTAGARTQQVALLDGTQMVVAMTHHMTVLP